MRPTTAHALRGPACTLCDVIKYGYFQQVRLLISTGMDLEARDNKRRTPLILCAFMTPEAWGMSIAMTLIENGVRVAQRDSYGRNVLHYACIYERKNLVRVLLRAIDFDLNQADKMGNTALHYAAMSGNLAVTQVLAQSFKKYRINGYRRNNQGKTAQEEAILAGNSACAHAILLELTGRRPGSAVKDVRFADDVVFGAIGSRSASQNSSPLSSRRVPRPMSAAFLTRRDSSSSINSTDEPRSSYSYKTRSTLSLPIRSGYRKSQNPLYANGYKKDEEVIHCAAENDFRNKPDYVFKLVHMPYEPDFGWEPGSLLDSTNRSSCWADTCSSVSQSQHVIPSDWRQDFKKLFKVYENQCSASWRATKIAEKPAEEITTITSPRPEEEEKGRRGRRPSVVSRTSYGHGPHGHGKETSPELKRRVSTSKLRRMPSTLGKSGGPTMDGALDTSSESINSLASTKKRGVVDGMQQQQTLGRQDSLNLKHSTKLQGDTTLQSSDLAPASPPLAGATTSSTLDNSIRDQSNQPPNKITKPSTSPHLQGDNSQRQAMPGIPQTSEPVKATPAEISTSSGHRNSNTDGQISGGTTPTQNFRGHNDSKASVLPGNIPRVKETLVAEERRRSSASLPREVDTNKLWVQNPYDDDDNNDDNEEGDIDNY